MSDVKTAPRFEHVYNADGTCHAANCGARGLILAFDEFSPEIAQWFCGMHWADCVGVDMLTVAEDLRQPLFPFFGGTYNVREDSPGVFTHAWNFPALSHDALMDLIAEGTVTGVSVSAPPATGRLYRRYCRRLARRDRYAILHQRARERTRRQHRAAFRRRKRGLA